MNRAARRGNTVGVRSSTGLGKLGRLQRSQERSGARDGPGNGADGSEQASQGRNTARDRTGRFAAAPAASATIALPPALTRQQRRYQERQAAKVAKAWRGVTKGDGVTLLDGQPID